MQVVQTRPRRLYWEDSDWKLPNQHHPQLIKRNLTKAADALTPSLRDLFLTSPFSAHWENSVAHCKSPSCSIRWENSSCRLTLKTFWEKSVAKLRILSRLKSFLRDLKLQTVLLNILYSDNSDASCRFALLDSLRKFCRYIAGSNTALYSLRKNRLNSNFLSKPLWATGLQIFNSS